MGGRSFRDLMVWQQAIELVDLVYVCTRTWPNSETFGLSSQIRRAAELIPANIAEGQGRNGRREFVNILSIANGSLCELETLAVIARRQEYLTADQEALISQQSRRVASLLNGLLKSLRSDD